MLKSKHRTLGLFGLCSSIGKFIVNMGDICDNSNPTLRSIFDGMVQKNCQEKIITQNI